MFINDPAVRKMVKYDNRKKQENQQYVSLTKIVVPSEWDKQQLLMAFKYIHDLRNIDSDYMAVNTIMHMYACPDLIEVQNED